MTSREEWQASAEHLHIFAQHHWHDSAEIVGTRPAMIALRDALNRALEDADGVAMSADVFTTDGEGYTVSVFVLPFAEMERMHLPYTDESLCHRPADRMWPSQLARKPQRPPTKPSQPEAREHE